VQKSPLGLALISIGLLLAVAGVLVWLGALNWFGRLPGDIRIERPGFRLYAPMVSMLIVSLLLTALTAFIRRFWP
jgi:hypothetical protein